MFSLIGFKKNTVLSISADTIFYVMSVCLADSSTLICARGHSNLSETAIKNSSETIKRRVRKPLTQISLESDLFV
jgi:hypothetical protein